MRNSDRVHGNGLSLPHSVWGLHCEDLKAGQLGGWGSESSGSIFTFMPGGWSWLLAGA